MALVVEVTLPMLQQSCAALQDVVTQSGKFLLLYKRPGHRVIVNSLGVIMVSPSAIETSVQQRSGGMAFLFYCFVTLHSP